MPNRVGEGASSEPRTMLERLTSAVREADEQHRVDGGGTRHWVRDCFLPALETAGLRVVEQQSGTEGERLREALEKIAARAPADSRTGWGPALSGAEAYNVARAALVPESPQQSGTEGERHGADPPRDSLPPEVEAAARTIHKEVWNEPYRAGRGPMHFAGGPFHAADLRRRADRWERMAVAARVCADFLPGDDS